MTFYFCSVANATGGSQPPRLDRLSCSPGSGGITRWLIAWPCKRIRYRHCCSPDIWPGAVVQAEFCIRPVCLVPGPRLFFVLGLVAPPLTRPPVHSGPSIVMWRSTGTPRRAPGHPATDRRTARHDTAH